MALAFRSGDGALALRAGITELPFIQARSQGKFFRKLDPMEAAKAVIKKAKASKVEMDKKEKVEKDEKMENKEKIEKSKKEKAVKRKKKEEEKMLYYAELKLTKERKAQLAIERKMKKQKKASSLPVSSPILEVASENSEEIEVVDIISEQEVEPASIVNGENSAEFEVVENTSGQPASTNEGKEEEKERKREDFEANFELVEEISSGCFGTVFKARCKKDNTFVAVKVIKRSELEKQFGSKDFAIEAVNKEAQIMRTLNGQRNMLNFHGAYKDDEKFYFVMELCEGGDLSDAYKTGYVTLTENETRFLIKEILAAVLVCHCSGIVHRDLKLENFVFAAKGNIRSIRLIDFGVSEFLVPGEKLDTIVGTPGHMAPEVFDGDSGYEADCWSIGVIAHFLLTKKFPFPDPTHNSWEIESWRPDPQGPDFNDFRWRLVPSEAREFVEGLLHQDPRQRFTVLQALGHEYMRGRTDIC